VSRPPAGHQPAVREVGRKLGVEHAQLDADLRAVAGKLDVPLPSQPSDQQKVWMAEITARPSEVRHHLHQRGAAPPTGR